MSDIDLKQPSIELFSDVAASQARKIAESSGRDSNKSTQLRGFYDEIVNWEARSRQLNDDEVQAQLPLIQMLIAKVAYAKARNHVSQEFEDLMRTCIKQVKDKTTLRNCKLFFEAFMGFYKAHKPK